MIFSKKIEFTSFLIIISIAVFVIACDSGKRVEQQMETTAIVKTFDKSIVNDNNIQPTITTSTVGPDNITRNLMQDSKGSFWFPTWDELYKYDGKIFTHFEFKGMKNPFFSAMEAKNGELWFGTLNSGIYRYDGTAFANMTTEDGLGNNRIYCMMEDNEGNIWFGTQDGVSRYDGKEFTNFTTKDGLSSNQVNSIIQDKDGIIWIGTTKGISFYNEDLSIELVKPNGESFEGTNQIIESKSGDIWIASFDGLYRYDGKSTTKISDISAQYLLEDSKENIWFSGDNPTFTTYSSVLPPMSLYRYDGKNRTTIITKSEEFDCQIFGIIEDKNSDIWFGTTEGVCRYDGTDFTYFKE